MLPSIRSRMKSNQAWDSAGTPWGDSVSPEAINRIAAFWATRVNEYTNFWKQVSFVLVSQAGHSIGYKFDEDDLKRCRDQKIILDAIAAFSMALQINNLNDLNEEYKNWVNKVLNEHRIGYKFVENELYSFEDDYLMREVVETAIGVLIPSKFSDARNAYQDALEEITRGNAGNALTDCGTALQAMFTALGCEGNTLKSLKNSAKNKGILGDQDAPLMQSIISAIDWVSSERNQISDAHRVSPANLADAWMMVHVVGALIVRLADESPRPEPPK